jgi:adenylate cyclase
MRRLIRALGLGLFTGGLGVLLALTPFGAAIEEEIGLSWLFRMRGAVPAPPEVVVVTLDRRSADALGLPAQPRAWPRALHAEVIDNLATAGAAAIVVDLILDNEGDPEGDAALALAMQASGRVLLAGFLDRRTEPILDTQGRPTGLVSIEERLVPPIEAFTRAARGTGPFPLPRTPARVSQFWAFKSGAGEMPTLPVLALLLQADPLWPTFQGLLAEAGAAAAARLPSPATAPDLADLARSLRLAFTRDPGLDERIVGLLAAAPDVVADEQVRRRLAALADALAGPGSRHLAFYGPPGHIASIAYAAALDGRLPELDGRIVLLGVAQFGEAGALDGFDTVYTGNGGQRLSGVEIMATAAANLARGEAPAPLDQPAEAGLLLGLGLMLGAIAVLLPAVLAAPLALGLGLAHLGLAAYAFAHASLWLPLALPLLAQIPVALLLGLIGRYRDAQRARRRVGEAIRWYVPESVAHGLDADRPEAATPDRLVYGVCLATDAERFTTLSETLPPVELKALLNAYFEALVEPVRRHGGTVSDIVADGMMCLWTSPAPDPALRAAACRAALEVARAADAFNAVPGRPRLPTRIGLHAGWVTLGNVGGGGRFAYSVVGDIANTTSRLEGLNKALGTRVLASEAALEGVEGVLARPLGRFRLRGKSGGLQVYELLAPAEAATPAGRRLVERFAGALALQESGHALEAADAFQSLLADHPEDGPSRFHLERSRRHLLGAPSGEELTEIRLESG